MSGSDNRLGYLGRRRPATAAIRRELAAASAEAEAVTGAAREIIAEIEAGQIDDEWASLNIDDASEMAANLAALAARAEALAARMTAAPWMADATLAAQARKAAAAMVKMAERSRRIARKINAAIADFNAGDESAAPSMPT